MRIRLRWQRHGELDSCPESRVKRGLTTAYLGSYRKIKMTSQLHAPAPIRQSISRGLSRRNAIRCLASLGGGYALATASRAIAEEVPLAIKGYDPVAYFTDGKPVRGLPETEYVWDEHRYLFSNA